MGMADTDIAEFIIDMSSEHGTVKAFRAAVADAGAELSEEFAGALLRTVQALQSTGKTSATSGAAAVPGQGVATKFDALASMFPALAMPDKSSQPADFESLNAIGMAAEVPGEGHRAGRARSRSRSPARDNRRGRRASRSPPRGYDQKLELYGIYNARVVKLMRFGAMVELTHVRGRPEGMVHVSVMSASKHVEDPTEVVHFGDHVWVKVISITARQIRCSMRDVDQRTGADILPQRQQGAHPDSAAAPAATEAPAAQSTLAQRGYGAAAGRTAPRMKRLTSPERFEMQQLRASGVLGAADMPDFDEEQGVLAAADEDLEDVEVDVREEDPPFLRGVAHSMRELSPVRVVRNPDGSMQRAAMAQIEAGKERREFKRQKQLDQYAGIPTDYGREWNDPMVSSKLMAADVQDTVRASGAMDQEPSFQKTSWMSSFATAASDKPLADVRRSLPIFQLREKFLELMDHEQVIVVVGETGSGKTTQMAQYLHEAGYTRHGLIGCTQPRRVAAKSVAERVAKEMGVRLGKDVGYSVRFDDTTSPETVIKYMTDGMLLREYLNDCALSKYSVMILDEAHERTINTDVLFGLLKGVLRRRKDFKLICTSATLESEKFSRYFFGCPVLNIPGRSYEVEILYAKEPEEDYLEAAMQTVMDIHLHERPGDILVFLTGQEEIETATNTLDARISRLGRDVPQLVLTPVYANLDPEAQNRIFMPAPPGGRKVVLATNIAEASITIDGIYYVVDTGFCKQNVYNPKSGIDSLQVVPISQASAKQRAGRAGRTGPGKCYRLYTEEAFNYEMLPATLPEIQRANLANVVLQLKAMGINDLLHFDFMDPPPPAALVESLKALYEIGALDDEGLLTSTGRRMAEFPMAPALAKALLTAVELHCSAEVLTIVSMLEVDNVWSRPRDKQAAADAKKAKYHADQGDHITLLEVYRAWESSGCSAAWCRENFLQHRSLQLARDVRKQLQGIMDRHHLAVLSAGSNYSTVCKAIIAGFFRNTAKKDPQEGYRTMTDNAAVYIHPGSAAFQRQPQWVLYHKVVLTSKEYMHGCMAVDPRWLAEMAPRFYAVTDAHTIGKRKRSERIEPLFDRHNPKDSWRMKARIAYQS